MAGLRAGLLLGCGVAVWLVSTGPLAPFRRAFLDRSPPQLVMVLGGDVDRERVGARLARELDLPLLISGGSNPEYATWVMQQEGLAPERVQLDTGPATPSAISPPWWMSCRPGGCDMC